MSSIQSELDDPSGESREQSLARIQGAFGLAADFTPGVGDVKGFAEAQSGVDYLLATVGLVPVVGDLVKKAADALDKGDIEVAQSLLDQAKLAWNDSPKLLEYKPELPSNQLTGGTDKSAGDLATGPPEGIPDSAVRDLTISEIYGIPEGKNFEKWFDSKTVEEIVLLYKDPKSRDIIKSRLRHGGGDHEWLMVSRAAQVKSWGISYEDIVTMVTPTKTTLFRDPSNGVIKKHGTNSISSKAHKELGELIDSSNSFDQFKVKINNWAEYSGWLPNGRRDLPDALRM
ncbi:hypothetical protein [Enterovibrio norvegicus]|uniref:hypothetical protein n=1 Tax=Enterovibrio norvegicus TaxID=188144 RepID=UPI000C84B6EE|nr:hypothetical protein [Enterovibrio norvegicus]